MKKKNPSLIPSKNFNFQIGLAVSLALTLIAFEWQTTDYVIKPIESVYTDLLEEEAIPITKTNDIKPIPELREPSIEKIVKELPNKIELKPEPGFFEFEIGVDIDSLFINEPEVPETLPFLPWAEVMPEFVGGEFDRMNYLVNNIKYPRDAKLRGISGVVYVSFVVEKDGAITRIAAENNPGGGLAQEALRVVKNMPNWKAGKQAEQPVAVKITMPIGFKLQ